MLDDIVMRCLNGFSGNASVVFRKLQGEENSFVYNGNKIYSSASTIKLLIAVEAFNKVLQGKFKLDDKISIKNEDRVAYSIITDLNSNMYSYLDLVTLMLIVSDNTATNVLIDLLGFDAINLMAEKMELRSTRLQRKMMDFKASGEGRDNLTTAVDMANLLQAVYNIKVLDHNMCSLLINILKKQREKRTLSRYLPEEVIIAHKSGELDYINHDIGIFYLPSVTYILGVFTSQAASNLEARRLIGFISKEVYEFLQEGVR